MELSWFSYFFDNLSTSASLLAPDTFESYHLLHKSLLRGSRRMEHTARPSPAWAKSGPSLASSSGRRLLCVLPLFSASLMKLISSRNDQFSASPVELFAKVQLPAHLPTFKNLSKTPIFQNMFLYFVCAAWWARWKVRQYWPELWQYCCELQMKWTCSCRKRSQFIAFMGVKFRQRCWWNENNARPQADAWNGADAWTNTQ